MVSLTQLWAPVLAAAVFVFIASSLVHMVFKWHNSDYRKLPNEEEVLAAVRAGNPAPGQYVFPHCLDMKEMESPEMQRKFTEGPVGFLVLKAPCPPSMGLPLGLWFLFCGIVSFFAAYLASRLLPAGNPCLSVFRLTATVSFLAYAGGAAPAAIWMGKPWSSAAKEVLDGLLYSLVTGGAFGWLWPH